MGHFHFRFPVMICHSNHRVLNTSQHATPVRTNEKAANTSGYLRHLGAQIFLDEQLTAGLGNYCGVHPILGHAEYMEKWSVGVGGWLRGVDEA